MPDVTYQPPIRHELGGKQLTFGNGSTLNLEPGHLFQTFDGVGTAGVGVVTDKVGTLHRTLITLTNVAVATTDHTTNGAQGTATLYNFPRGYIGVWGGKTNLTITGDGVNITATAAVISSVGTAAAAADLTLTGTEANIIASTATSLTASVGAFKGNPTGTTVFIDNTTTTNSTNMIAVLNFDIPDAGSSANGTITVTGTVELLWSNFGDS